MNLIALRLRIHELSLSLSPFLPPCLSLSLALYLSVCLFLLLSPSVSFLDFPEQKKNV